uniref:hypothetical protein n=1 Tax=uncultured Halomonas sp. TaxID=173971 RepID=UPI0026237D1F|nr:hypothetical protein [uncultured Halomonas sp.]
MAQFLVVISKSSRQKFNARKEAEQQSGLLANVAKNYKIFLGLDYDPKPQIVTTSSRGTESVLAFRRYGKKGFENVRGDRWIVTAGQDVQKELNSTLRVRNGQLSYKKPVWGQYAAVFGERWNDRVTAWNTVPALETIHWGEDSSYIYLSNRPLLVALGLTGGRRAKVRLSDDYAIEYLAVGYNVTGQTPFEGVATIPVDYSLVVQCGKAHLKQIPPGLESSLDEDHTLEEGVDALTEALKSSMDRVQDQIGNRPLQLRMSGGKDSRLLLGLLRGRKVDARAVTFGNEKDMDVRLARRMVGMAGIPHEVRQPNAVDAGDESERIIRTLFESGGMPLSEAHTIRYRGADVLCHGESIMLGQYPLFKGGLARRMKSNTLEASRKRVLSQVSPFIECGVKDRLIDWLNEWVEQVPASNELEKQYLFTRQFRSASYMQAHIAHYGRDAMIAYPIGDHQVTAVSDVLTMAEKLSQKTLFGAMERIWPEVMAVPLDKSVWNFEINGPDPKLSGPYFKERYAPLPRYESEYGLMTEAHQGGDEYSEKIGSELINGLKHDGGLKDMLPLMRSDIRESVVQNVGSTVFHVPSGVSKKDYIKFLWRVRVIDLWKSRSWIPDE